MAKFKNPVVISSDENFDYLKHVNYGKYIVDRLLLNEEQIALIDGQNEEKITCGEMVNRVMHATSSLEQLGVRPGEIVGICSENRIEFMTTAIGAFCADVVVTFINSAYCKDDFLYTMKIAKPVFMFMSPKTYASYFETINDLDFVNKIVIFGTDITQDVISLNRPNCNGMNDLSRTFVHHNNSGLVQVDNEHSTALILYSSGTTGLPKGVKLSHKNLIISALHPLSNKGNGILLTLTPWSNVFGIISTVRMLVSQQTVVFFNKFIEETYYECIAKYKVSILITVPSMIVIFTRSQTIKNYDVACVELIYSGGAVLNAEVIIKAKEIFNDNIKILQGYGMTEAGVVTEETENATKEGSVGTIAKGVIIKLVDVNSGKMLGPYRRGEVCIKGPNLFQGYIGRDLKEDLDADGFYKTGDAAYYDEDGYFYIVDRQKDIIKYKAAQVSASELETILRDHPAVKDVGVIGTPDTLAGELPTAFVVRSLETDVTEKEIVDFVAGKVSSWKRLRGGVRFVHEIPKTANGKILRRKLRELLNV